MAKRLALVALLLCIATLFLPVVKQDFLGTEFTRGIFVGTEKKTELLLFVAPSALAALLGVLIGRSGFGRGLGVLNFLFGAINLLLLGTVLFSDEREISLATGAFTALGAALLVTFAGVIGLVKPERKA